MTEVKLLELHPEVYTIFDSLNLVRDKLAQPVA